MSSHYLTFDIGTTALKTALIRADGTAAAVHAEEYTPDAPQPGWAEMPVERYWQAAVRGTQMVLQAAALPPSAIRAIGFSAQGQTFVPLDRQGRPLSPAIVWTDTRAQGITEEWERRWLSRVRFYEISGYGWLPAGLTVFKIAWLAQHHAAAHRSWKFLCLPDYLGYRLTGETATDFVTARMSGLYDRHTDAWSPELLAAAGIDATQLPTVLPPGSVFGHLQPAAAAALGLPAGIPVCTGANDQLAGALGAGNTLAGIMTETTGTALALIVSAASLAADPRVVIGRHAVPGLSYAMTFATTSAIILTWFRDLCGSGEDYASLLAGAEQIAPGCDGLTVLPHFAGTLEYPESRGALLGLSLAHTRAHVVRAIMESVTCLLRECLEPLTAQQVPVTCIRALGGAAHSDLWLQMKADMLGLPVERPACAHAASVGAALLAAVGVGQYPSVQAAADAWYRPARVFTPNPELRTAYDAVYMRYRRYCELWYPAPVAPI